MEAIANVVLFIIILVDLVIWVISLVNWDGKCHCDKSQCDTCPFPCCDEEGDNNDQD